MLSLKPLLILEQLLESMHIPNLNTYTERSIKGIGAVLDPDLPQNCKLLRTFLYGDNSETEDSFASTD